MKKTTMLLVALTLAVSTYAQDYFNNEGVAIKGYDVVAYHTQNTAIEGDSQYAVENDGVKWYFASAENMKLFQATPEKYKPAYGGYCAFAVGKMNQKVPVDPETFKIYNGELLLFFNDEYQGKPMNTIIPWNQDEKELKAAADKNWSSLK